MADAERLELYRTVLFRIGRCGLCADIEEVRYQLKVKDRIELTENELMDLCAEMEKAELVKARLVFISTSQGRDLLAEPTSDPGAVPG